jgi:outer membrane immunogenic protein
MRRFVVAAFVSSIVLAAAGAQAADIPMKAPVAAPMMAPAFDWNGFYIGAHAGYAWGRTSIVDSGAPTAVPPVNAYNRVTGDSWSFRTSGLVAGGQLGWNWWINPLLFGIEADLGYLGARGSGFAPAGCAAFGCDTVGSVRSDFYATLRGRLGVTAGPDLLLYVTGGGIGINQRTSVIDACSAFPCGAAVTSAEDRSFRLGWTAGGGAEWHIPGTKWSVKGEWLYYDIGGKRLSALAFLPPTMLSSGPFNWDTKSTGHIARVGLNWHF